MFDDEFAKMVHKDVKNVDELRKAIGEDPIERLEG